MASLPRSRILRARDGGDGRPGPDGRGLFSARRSRASAVSLGTARGRRARQGTAPGGAAGSRSTGRARPRLCPQDLARSRTPHRTEQDPGGRRPHHRHHALGPEGTHPQRAHQRAGAPFHLSRDRQSGLESQRSGSRHPGRDLGGVPVGAPQHHRRADPGHTADRAGLAVASAQDRRAGPATRRDRGRPALAAAGRRGRLGRRGAFHPAPVHALVSRGYGDRRHAAAEIPVPETVGELRTAAAGGCRSHHRTVPDHPRSGFRPGRHAARRRPVSVRRRRGDHRLGNRPAVTVGQGPRPDTRSRAAAQTAHAAAAGRPGGELRRSRPRLAGTPRHRRRQPATRPPAACRRDLTAVAARLYPAHSGTAGAFPLPALRRRHGRAGCRGRRRTRLPQSVELHDPRAGANGAGLFALWILLWLVFRAFEGLVEGEAPLAQRVRDLLGAAERESRTSFGFIQLVIDLFLWIAFVVYVIYVWDSSGNTLDRLEYRIFEGWEIGQLELVPSEIVKGILILTALIVVTGWIKRWIDRRWLRHMALDRGARDALVTLFGYVGVVIAILIGLNVAGIDLTGLAWFVTALGLGIGFGLQAIASNFVSGLILLFERPIKAGDFVTVGGTEGFVRRVRIRATDIETLDNQNVLVPNSELVSGRVTNWVFRNPQGRLRIEVGVAYGSDIEKVRDILETIARDHPEVITDGRAPAPRALFMAFGESSLNFELRVRIKRIERRFTVISDINFAVDKAFREAGITIPFPQRDLHLISLPEQAKMDAAAAARREHEAEPAPPKPQAPPPVHPEEMTRSHSHEIRLTNRLETVWSTVTDEKWLVRWYARDAEVEPHIGGSYRVEFEDDSALEGRIDIFMPPRRMRVVRVPPEGDEHLPTGPITEEYIIREADGAVVLTIKVAGIPATEDWEEYYRSSEERWEQALAELQKVLKNRATAR